MDAGVIPQIAGRSRVINAAICSSELLETARCQRGDPLCPGGAKRLHGQWQRRRHIQRRRIGPDLFPGLHDQRPQFLGLVLMVNAAQRSDTDLFHIFNRRSIAGYMQVLNAAPVTVSAGKTAQMLVRSLPSGANYSVTIQSQPTGETCSIAGATGIIQSANVANVVVTCSNLAYSLGGSISGLNGSGLVLANGTDTLTVSSGAVSFTMPTAVAFTSGYVLTVQTQPAGLACAVGNAMGTMPAGAVTNVAITCTDQPFKLGGTISGLGNNAGLILTNGSDALSVAVGSASFTMPTPVAFGSPYSVAVLAAPAGLTCTASNASATMPAGNVASVVITCSDRSYTVGGTISGPAGQQHGARQWQRYARSDARCVKLHDAHRGGLHEHLRRERADAADGAYLLAQQYHGHDGQAQRSPISQSPAQPIHILWAVRSAGSRPAAWCC